MSWIGVIQILIPAAVLFLLVKPLGLYLFRVYEGKPIFLNRVFGWLEVLIYRLCGVRREEEMSWKGYVAAVLWFSAAGIALLYLLQQIQGNLPLNPQGLGPVSSDSSLNTAVSFVTNTNWQGYGGETTMSYLTQMLGMTVQNFLSAAAGVAMLMAFIRGLARRGAQTLGNFWVDLTRGTLYVFLPLSFVLAIFLVSEGSVQTFSSYPSVKLLEATKDKEGNPVQEQVLATGPVASQVAIKHLGTNGGGFFNANTAHPFESPTPLTDFVLVIAQLAIAAALTYTYGKMVGDTRQGWSILAVMLFVLLLCQFFAYAAEAQGNPRLAALGVDQAQSNLNPGGNMEGKEMRLGLAPSAIFAVSTTATSCGAVNAMHDSFTPLGGLIPLFLMHCGETIFGGVGSGLYGMLVFVIVAVFIAGLMVGRTPEYLGKKIEAHEIKMAALAILVMPLVVLVFTAIAVLIEAGTQSIANAGPHGFSEILYAYSSMANNNGSAFAGLSANTPFYNYTGTVAMLLGRFAVAIPTLALAGSLARKKRIPSGTGTLPTHTPLFSVLLIGIVILVGALTFIPALALGPIVEHLLLGS